MEASADRQTASDRRTTLDRRTVLAATAGLVGLSGCSMLGGGCGAVSVEGPDASRCVAPVESDQPVDEYYGFDTENRNSSATPDELEVADATVTFVYGAPWILGVVLVGVFLVARTVGEILHSPLVTALASDVGAVDDRGSHLSVVEMAKRLGFGLGPVIGGLYFDFGLTAWLWGSLLVGSGLLAAGLLAFERRIPAAVNGRPASGD